MATDAFIKSAIFKVVERQLDVKAKDIAYIARRVSNEVADGFFQDLAWIISRELNTAPEELDPFISTPWPELSSTPMPEHWGWGGGMTYKQYKYYKYNSQSFFLNKGVLFNDLLTLAGETAKVFGKPTSRQAVSVKSANVTTGYEIFITPFPNLDNLASNYAVSALVASYLGDNDKDIFKLMNRLGRTRELILPMIKYYSEMVIPKAIDAALEGTGYTVRRNG